MNHYAPREIQRDGQRTGSYRYTVQNDREDRAYAVGLCAEDCPGHPSPEEACAHFKQYLLSRLTFHYERTSEWPKNKCDVADCQCEATVLANVDSHRVFGVCATHATTEAVSTLFDIGESWVS